MLLGAAVEEERVTAPCEQRRRRVHQAHGHPDRTALRLLRDLRELESGQLEPGRPTEREGERHRQRRRRRQPGTDRQGRRDRSVESRGGPAPLAQQLGDGGRVANPACELRPSTPVRFELDRLRELGRAETDGRRIRPPAKSHAAVDGDGEDKTARMISVFPDEVDAAGRKDRGSAVNHT